MGRSIPYATYATLLVAVLVAWKVTGFLPSEAALEPVWWSRATMAEGQWHRLFTSIVAHGGPIHLLFNGIALASLGSLERDLGTPTFAGILVAAGVGGNLAHVATNTVPVVGLSGAIFGLMGVLLVLAPLTRLSLFGLPVPALVLLPLYLAAVVFLPGLQDLAPIAHWAHIGGLLTGILSGVLLAPKRGLAHLGYVGLAFLGLSTVLVTFREVPLSAIADAWKREGLIGVLAATWPAIAGLAVLALTLKFLADAESVEAS